MKFLKDAWMRLQLFIIKAVGSRKFYAWAVATVLLILNIITQEIWFGVTGLWVAAIAVEKIGTNNIKNIEGK